MPPGVRYVIVQDSQQTNTLPENEYIYALKHYNDEGTPWLGNLLVFKTCQGLEVEHIEERDLPLVKRLVTL